MHSAHPMEMLPYLRRWRPSPVRNLLYTLLWNSLVSMVFPLMALLLLGPNAAWRGTWWPSFVLAQCIGFSAHFMLIFFAKWSHGWPARSSGWPLRLYFMLIISASTGVGTILGSVLLGARNPLGYLLGDRMPNGALFFTLVISIIIFSTLMAAQKKVRMEAQAAHQREQIATSQALLLQAQLRTLQAQIEPHFLFNTLANCLSLMQTQPAQAQHMLARLIDFLRASLAASRAEQSTLGTEADLMASYLDLMVLRMGSRLRYQIEIDATLRPLPIAPMLLQPLLENAITHGLEPKLEGGLVTLKAKLEQEFLTMVIEDNGVGINPHASPRPGAGMGNTNVRQRISSLYGPQAQIQWAERTEADGGGVCVTIKIPRNNAHNNAHTLVENPTNLKAQL
jgi:Histidine kinase